jgi:hypothetical protein
MPKIDWYVVGIEFGNCHCDYACPCQFESLPTHGNCRGFEVVRIDKGHFGDIKLDGLNETKDEATHWWVYHAMSSRVHDPLVKPIEFEVDIDARTAKVRIPGVLEAVGGPIKSPATGQPHRVRIEIPNGIEFERAEVGSASTKATGAITLDLKDSYGQFNVAGSQPKTSIHVHNNPERP